MQPPVRIPLAVEGLAVPRHRVREGGAEEVVVAPVEAGDHVRQRVALLAAQARQVRHLARGDEERLEWPGRPEGHQRRPVRVGADDALTVPTLALEVIAQEVAPVLLPIAVLARRAAAGGGGHVRGRPHLAMGMRVAAPHHGALVLEHLDVADAVTRPQAHDLVGPCVDDEADRARLQAGQGEVVARREADDAADARLRMLPPQRVRGRFRRRLRGRAVGAQGGEVVVEGESAGVGRVAHAAGAPVARAQRALRVVARQRLLRRRLRLPLPGTVQPSGRAQHPLVEQRVVASVGVACRHGPPRRRPRECKRLHPLLLGVKTLIRAGRIVKEPLTRRGRDPNL